MKKPIISLLPLLFLILAVVSCDKDRYQSGPGGDGSQKGDEEIFAEKKDGRIALAYCTYYGSLVPDGRFLTHINYAFAELYVVDGVYQKFALQGSEDRFRKVLSARNKYPDVKICLSFSHTVSNKDNKQGGGFSAMASTEEGRKKFAEDCRAFCARWAIDGIDIDWEFPGISWSGHACDPANDVKNHVLLMKQLRETLGDKYILSYAGYVMDKRQISGGERYIDIAGCDPYVDYVNLMTYDLDAAPHHHSALLDKRAYWDIERTYKAYMDAGVNPSKLVLGIPFYGRISFSTSPTSITYKSIVNLGAGYKIDNWDEAASVPYVTYNGTFYCGYDNAKSIGIKGTWVRSKGLKGMMCWDYDSDDASGTLRKAMWNAVMQ